MRRGFSTLSWISLVAFGAIASTCTPDSDANAESVGMEDASPADAYEPSAVATTSVDTPSGPEATAAGQDIDIPAFQDHGDLNVEGVSRRMVTVWDEDGNSLLTEAEWSAAVRSWFGPDDHGAYPDWDADGFGELALRRARHQRRRTARPDRVGRRRGAKLGRLTPISR